MLSPTCPLWLKAPGTLGHLFWHCDATKDLRELLPFRLRPGCGPRCLSRLGVRSELPAVRRACNDLLARSDADRLRLDSWRLQITPGGAKGRERAGSNSTIGHAVLVYVFSLLLMRENCPPHFRVKHRPVAEPNCKPSCVFCGKLIALRYRSRYSHGLRDAVNLLNARAAGSLVVPAAQRDLWLQIFPVPLT